MTQRHNLFWAGVSQLTISTESNEGEIMEKKRMKKMLDRDLLRNPPPVSELNNSEMFNILRMFDGNRCPTNNWHLLQAMTDLYRFNRSLEPIKDVVISNRISNTDFIKEYAADFYGAWHISSTEVIKHVGWENSLEIFRLLKKLWLVAWPYDSVDYLQRDGMPKSFKVYRGESQQLAKQIQNGRLSWSLHKDNVNYYAKRFSDGVMHEGIVTFDDVLLFQLEEMEIVVNPGSVSITKTSSP